MLKQFEASDHTKLSYYDSGQGRLVLFQHGFSMDHRQVIEIWPDLDKTRLICLDVRGHGFTELASPDTLTIQHTVRDLLALFEHLGQTPTIVGGISLGAAITMELTKHLEIEQLIVCRPAFAPDGDTSHFDVFRRLRDIMQSEPQHQWAESLEQQPEFQSLAETAPRNQETYRRLLEHPRLQELMIWMDALETKVMTITGSELGQLNCRTDIIGQEQDALHPAQLARSLSHQIPHARLHYVVSGGSSDDAYRASMQSTLTQILTS
jgi:pimeloyl-ACP methyl ester carboxylesterase